MIIGIIVFLFCAAGIYGFYNGLIFLTYIGMALSIVEMIGGVVTKQSKSLWTLWLCILLSFGSLLAGNNFFVSLAILLCFENVILFIIGLFLLFIGSSTRKKRGRIKSAS